MSIVGPGNLGSALAIELFRAGYPIQAIVRRPTSKLALVGSILGIIFGAALMLGGLIASLATVVKFQSG